MMNKFKKARLVVKQIKAGEWIPEYNSYGNAYHTARRGHETLWLSNGGWFCDIVTSNLNGSNSFGYVWRHYVWWAAARKLKSDADKNTQQKFKDSLKETREFTQMIEKLDTAWHAKQEIDKALYDARRKKAGKKADTNKARRKKAGKKADTNKARHLWDDE